MASPPAPPAPTSAPQEDSDANNRPRTHRDQVHNQVERLMQRIDKPIVIERQGQRTAGPTDFVAHVSSSSAGAGSGDFHVYRALRRKELARVSQMESALNTDRRRTAYEQKRVDRLQAADDKTARNRAKRMRKKQNRGERNREGGSKDVDEDSEDRDDNEETEEPKRKMGQCNLSSTDATTAITAITGTAIPALTKSNTDVQARPVIQPKIRIIDEDAFL